MRDPQRIDRILARLKQVWNKNPDLRLGQILINAMSLKPCDHLDVALFYIEDEELADRIATVLGN